uniref:SBP-type domain-containing protein n=1 Tax=Rhizophora mucronata TaxID=61149 RepID=A0A2P2LXF6_RHIMU
MKQTSPPDAGQSSNQNDMEIHAPPVAEDPASSALWDWGDFLDFTVDDQFPISFGDSVDQAPTTPHQPDVTPTEEATTLVTERVRKRDPRLICSNFLAGRVPCACPEIDEKLLEEEEPGKKRVRMNRNMGSAVIRCQVPGCEADISELKGYHKRHRVCLRCANSSSVTVDGATKRYCQQCGKFHVLSDFDEGKRSCRRKLERHNNRRRRKAHEPRRACDNENQGNLQSQETACDLEAGKENLVVVKDTSFESEDGHMSSLQSDPNSQHLNSDSGLSFGASGETQMDAGKEDTKCSHSPSYRDNKSAYSSVCPTGRISFKLYDWNPAEFPRRLRHQIFQWLANMPVELEGYIRPGCTILTAFIAMPSSMWGKLYGDPISYLHDLLIVPGRMLSKRGPMLIYLNDMIFRVTRDGAAVIKLSMKGQVPRLHYVHPTCFEAGKPIEFIACGSNLLQTRFRFLVSFGGKYLTCDYCVALPFAQVEGGSSLDHQLYKIHIRHSEPNLVGPAFIEVENESGLSNFLPILIADREICHEMRKFQQTFKASNLSIARQCEASSLRQMTFSELLLDIAWSLKNPCENFQPFMTPLWNKRLNALLDFSLRHDLTTILDRIHQNLRITMDKSGVNNLMNGNGDADMRQLQECIDYSIDALLKKGYRSQDLAFQLEYTMQEGDIISDSCSGSDVSSVPTFSSEVRMPAFWSYSFFTCSVLIGIEKLSQHVIEFCCFFL